jgi:hypothetical protein
MDRNIGLGALVRMSCPVVPSNLSKAAGELIERDFLENEQHQEQQHQNNNTRTTTPGNNTRTPTIQ